MPRGGPQIVAREPDLAEVGAFLEEDRPRALVLTGGPGIGKTTVWEAGLEAARRQGLRVLMARPSEAEARLTLAALADLLAEVEDELLDTLSAPRRRALEVALLRADPQGLPPEPRAVAAGFLDVLRELAAGDPLLVAIDDVQWLDEPSADALAFAARRLDDDSVAFFLTARTGTPSTLVRTLEPMGLERIEISGLSLGATRRLLTDRLGLSLPRRALRKVFESTGGNPLFALEVGRVVAERGPPAIGEEIPVPDRVEDLLGVRVAGLPKRMRKVLLAAAVSGDLRVAQLAAVTDLEAIEDALHAGVVLVEGDRLRASHPLLAAAARSRSSASERRALHLELASVVADEGLRARHMALAATEPDGELASRVAGAASVAAARAAAEDAVELAEHALRLTPPESAVRIDRMLALAEYLIVAGQPQRATQLLGAEVDRLPPGPARARAHLLLAAESRLTTAHVDEAGYHLDQALAESEDEAALRATVMGTKARYAAVVRVERIRDAEAWALEALPAARRAGPDVERQVLYGLGWARALRGRSIDDVRERFRVLSDGVERTFRSSECLAAEIVAGRGDVREARAMFARLLALADEHGEAWTYARLRVSLCELELRAGEWDTAARILEEWVQSPDSDLLTAPAYGRCRALLAVGRGRPDEAEQWASRAIAESEASGLRWDWLEALRVGGTAALLAHEPRRAVERLRAVWEHTEHEGVEDPAFFPVAPELVEALVELGEPQEALAVTDRLSELAAQQAHPWGLATARRCRALIAFASGENEDEAASELAEASIDYDRLGLRFDRARTLLLLGRAQRRRRKWAAARRALEAAAEAFGEIGSPGWADQARSELARVGARRPRAAGELTPAEQRVVQLAMDGRSNKEIAAALFVGVHTVEVHLSHAYAKLGVRSRSQLASRLKV